MSLKICPKCKLISQEKDEKCQECKSELVDIEEYCEKYFVEKSFLSKIKSIFIETKEDKINKEIITIASLQRKISDFNKEFAKLQEDYTFKKDFDKFKDKYKEYKSKLDDLNYIDEIKKINRDFTNEITHFENSFKNMDKKIEDNNLNYLLNEQKNFKEDWEELTKEFIEKPDEFKNKYSSYFEKINDADIGENKDLKEVKEISKNFDSIINEKNIEILKQGCSDFKENYQNLTDHYVEDYDDFKNKYESYFDKINKLNTSTDEFNEINNIYANLDENIKENNEKILENEYSIFEKDWKDLTSNFVNNSSDFESKYETYFERVSKTETNSENLLEVKEIANNFENTINSINELYSTSDETEKLIDELESTTVFIDEDKKTYFKKSFYSLNDNAKQNAHALKHMNPYSRTTISNMEDIYTNIDSKINSININILNNEIPQFKKDWKKFTSKYIDNPNTFKEKYQDYHNKISTLTLKGNFKLNLVKKIFSNYNQIIESINVLYKNIETGNNIIYFCEKPNRYLDRRLKKEIKNEMKAIIKIFKTNKKYIENLNKKAQEDITEIKRKNDYIDEYLEKKKEKYVKNELKENKEFFDDFDGKKLDENQRKAVVINEINNQIIAGAGSGKSLTLAAKIKYLIDKKGIDAREILCLTYSNASKNDLKKKVPDEVEVKTFHGLGNSILKEKDPEVYAFDKCFNTFILEKEDITEMVVTFFSKYFNPLVTDAESLGEFYKIEAGRNLETLKSVELKEIYDKEKKLNKEEKTTLKNEIVKSTEELIIANFLYLNGVDYVYEISYPHEDHYKPDF